MNSTIRLVIGGIAGVVLLVMGIARSNLVPEIVGILVIVLCCARMLLRTKKSQQ